MLTMPEELEINTQKKELVNKHKIEGCVISSIENKRPKEKAHNFKVLKALKKLLPLTIDKVLTKGKELAFTFTNGYKLVFGMATGGYFAVADKSKLSEFPFNERTNFCMVTSTGKTVFVMECNSSQNQISLELKNKDEEIFDKLRGPDLIDSSAEELQANLSLFLNSENKFIQNYFDKATLLDVCHNQSLFNGLGAYTTTEVLHWLWLLKGVRPWENGAAFLKDEDNQKLLINIVKTYFQMMLDYLRPGTPDSDLDCTSFNERKWLDFRGIFVRCYREHVAADRNGKRQPVSKYGKYLVHCSKMKVTKNIGYMYLVDLTEEEKAFLAHDGWTPKAALPFTKHSLGVGMHNWWGPKEQKDALESPVKAVQQLVELRPPTRDSLLKSHPVKRKLDEISSVSSYEEEMEIQPPTKKQKTRKDATKNTREEEQDNSEEEKESASKDSQRKKKKRPNKRRRWIHKLYENMKNLVKTD